MQDWIENNIDLTKWLNSQEMQSVDLLGLDTEFMRTNTFWPNLALIQLATAQRYALVDPLDISTFTPLQQALINQRITKIIHSASEDVVALCTIMPQPIQNLFDTQIAAAFTGLGASISYQNLVATLLGHDLPKAETRSNWLMRPLSTEQLHYAKQDVIYLIPLYLYLHEKLDALGRIAWCSEECARLAHNNNMPYTHDWHENIHHATRYTTIQQTYLKRLFIWREATARQYNRPRNWVLDQAHMVQLAERPPRDIQSLALFLNTQKAFPTAALTALWETIQATVTDAEIECAQAPVELNKSQKQQYKKIQVHIVQLATELNIPATLLANRFIIEQIIRGKRPQTTQGWRYPYLRQAVENIIDWQ